MTNSGNNCFKLPLKTTAEDKEMQEVTVSLAHSKEISMDSTVSAVLSELDGISRRIEWSTKGFFSVDNTFPFSPDCSDVCPVSFLASIG